MTSSACRVCREKKAEKILAILRDFLGDLSGLKCLDVGCGQGVITAKLAEEFGFVVGMDLKRSEFHKAWCKEQQTNLQFIYADGCHLPFRTGHFDVVVCAQVYEHVRNQRMLASEIWRVLRSGGVCFFSGPNRWALIEEHYWLPFLSWLPAPLSDRYVRLLRGQPRYDVWPLSFWQLQSMWHKFLIYDYTISLLKSPERFGLSEKALHILRYVPTRVLSLLLPFVPNYNWILVKR